MVDDPTQNPSEALTPAQQALADLWERHLASEFETKSATEALSTMVPDAYVNHMPVLTGGRGHAALEQFYAHHFMGALAALGPVGVEGGIPRHDVFRRQPHDLRGRRPFFGPPPTLAQLVTRPGFNVARPHGCPPSPVRT